MYFDDKENVELSDGSEWEVTGFDVTDDDREDITLVLTLWRIDEYNNGEYRKVNIAYVKESSHRVLYDVMCEGWGDCADQEEANRIAEELLEATESIGLLTFEYKYDEELFKSLSDKKKNKMYSEIIDELRYRCLGAAEEFYQMIKDRDEE